MRQAVLATAAMIALTGCSQGGPGESRSDEAVSLDMAAPAASPPPGGAAEAAPTGPASPPAVAATAASIAYVYRYALELPTDRAGALMARHEKACVDAGPLVCQVIGAQSDRVGRDALSARLEIRGTPAFLARFRAGLAAEAEQAGGRVASAATESEDLTRALTDTEAALRAATTLRDRLQQLLATRNGPLEQLLQVERELARVQGEIDATQSALAVMRTRVATSRLEIEYRAEGRIAPDSAFRPVIEAVQGAVGLFMITLGGLISLIAILLPIGLVAGPIGWWLLKRRRRDRARRADARASAATPTDASPIP